VAGLAPGVRGGVTCQGRGLEYPHQNDRPVLAAGPGWASAKWDRSHRVRGYDRGWKGLDGYAGDPAGGGGPAAGGRGKR
jgi:hypothetical protein